MPPIAAVHTHPLLPTHIPQASSAAGSSSSPSIPNPSLDGLALHLTTVGNRAPGWATVRNTVVGGAALIAVLALLYVTMLQSPLHWDHPAQQAGSAQARLQLGLDAAQKHG